VSPSRAETVAVFKVGDETIRGVKGRNFRVELMFSEQRLHCASLERPVCEKTSWPDENLSNEIAHRPLLINGENPGA
jgi:hypothetical protein